MAADSKNIVPSNGILLVNRQGQQVFRQGLISPSTLSIKDDAAETVLNVQELERVVLKSHKENREEDERHHHAQTQDKKSQWSCSVKFYQKHPQWFPPDWPIKWDEEWEGEDEYHDKVYGDNETKETYLLFGITSDSGNHSRSLYSHFGCPLKRRLYMIYLPPGIDWAHFLTVVERLYGDEEPQSILAAMDEITVERAGLEWQELLEVDWIAESNAENADENPAQITTCRISAERRGSSGECWEPWRDGADDGASFLRQTEIIYQLVQN
ncbi:hypothetical protein F5884DRAFT_751089 [Xylogone sp. PMI_703]|nr:hypothetical protein F5884DRAFT_751089 [Xylogone sp. PMI_703]